MTSSSSPDQSRDWPAVRKELRQELLLATESVELQTAGRVPALAYRGAVREILEYVQPDDGELGVCLPIVVPLGRDGQPRHGDDPGKAAMGLIACFNQRAIAAWYTGVVGTSSYSVSYTTLTGVEPVDFESGAVGFNITESGEEAGERWSATWTLMLAEEKDPQVSSWHQRLLGGALCRGAGLELPAELQEPQGEESDIPVAVVPDLPTRDTAALAPAAAALATTLAHDLLDQARSMRTFLDLTPHQAIDAAAGAALKAGPEAEILERATLLRTARAEAR